MSKNLSRIIGAIAGILLCVIVGVGGIAIFPQRFIRLVNKYPTLPNELDLWGERIGSTVAILIGIVVVVFLVFLVFTKSEETD